MAVEMSVRIDGKNVKMRASALIPRLYRAKFGRDLMADMRILGEAAQKRKNAFSIDELTIFEDVAYIMVKHANPDVPDTPEEWLDSIDGVFSIYAVLPVILRLWNLNRATTSEPKKKESPRPG